MKYTDKQKEKALQLVEQGMKLSEIASKLKINYKTLCKWVSDYKKKAEFEGSNAVLADITEDGWTEDGINRYNCWDDTLPCEVTPDTDMEEYNKAWAEKLAKKEEPASAATDTDSESESLGKNSEPIITENTEIVKALPEVLPSVIFDAILEKKDAVLKMIAAEEQLLKSLYADLAVLDEFIYREGGSDE